jgi:fructose-1-phosphate kinase PfkB-like protein
MKSASKSRGFAKQPGDSTKHTAINLIVGLNPALQRTIDVPNLKAGSVNRAKGAQVGVGGKGQNVLVASSCMDLSTPSHILQFLGTGFEGDALIACLNKRFNATSDLSKFSIRTAAPCRTCITLVDSGSGLSTEIIEPSGTITTEEVSMLNTALSTSFDTKARGVAIMGSMPPGCPSDLYASIIAQSCGPESTVLIDLGTNRRIGTCHIPCPSVAKPC